MQGEQGWMWVRSLILSMAQSWRPPALYHTWSCPAMVVVQEEGHPIRKRHSGTISLCSRAVAQPVRPQAARELQYGTRPPWNSDISHARCSSHRTYWEFPLGGGFFFSHSRAVKYFPACSSVPEVAPQGMDASRPYPFPSASRSWQQLRSWAFNELSVKTFLKKLL